MICGIDTGSEYSAWLLLEEGHPIAWEIEPAERLVGRVQAMAEEPGALLAVEHIEALYGGTATSDLLRACEWGAIYRWAWTQAGGAEPVKLQRPTIKTHLLGRADGNDAKIRAACIDRFGGRERALTGKRCPDCKGKGWVGRRRPPCERCEASGWLIPPGPLSGITGDCWAALAVALVAHDLQQEAA